MIFRNFFIFAGYFLEAFDIVRAWVTRFFRRLNLKQWCYTHSHFISGMKLLFGFVAFITFIIIVGIYEERNTPRTYYHGADPRCHAHFSETPLTEEQKSAQYDPHCNPVRDDDE